MIYKMSERYHRAARDGFLDVLRETTKRDCNHQDEDGLTPTSCAAYEGKIHALRILVGRGGDPDKSDNYGNTALHCASARGHMECVSFLVNFGANIWALDNDFHSAKDLAAINSKEEVLRFLDSKESQMEKIDPKKAKKLQEKSRKDAEKKQKEFERLKEKADKKRQQEERVLKETDKTNIENANPEPKKKSFFGTITQNSKSLLSGSQRGTTNVLNSNSQNAPRFSDLTQNNQNNKKTMSAIHQRLQRKKIKEETKNNSDFKIREGSNSIRKLSGVRGGTEIMYVKNESFSSGSSESPTLGRRGKIPEEFKREIDDPVYVPGLLTRTTSVPDFGESNPIYQQRGSMFGFGEIGFRHPFTPTMTALQSKISSSNSSEDDGLPADSSLPFEEQDLPSDDEEVASPVYLFLAANGLQNYIPIFAKEHIDLDALMLLTDQDLESMRLPLGPRRKLLKAINDRRDSLEQPGEVIDIRL